MKKNLILGLCLLLSVGCSQPASNTSTSTPAPTSTSATGSPSPAGSPATSPSASESPSDQARGDGTTMTHQECGVEFTLPAGWKQEEGQQHLMVNPEDGTMVVFFITPGEEGVDAAGDAIEKIITEVVQEPEIEGEGEETNINGMEAFSFNGKGKSEGKDVIFSVDFIKAKKPLIVLALGEQDGVAKHAAEVDALAGSLKPIAGSDAPADEPADEEGKQE